MTGSRACRVLTIALGALAALLIATSAGLASAGRCQAPLGAAMLANDNGSKAWRVTADAGPGVPDLRSWFACARGQQPFRFEHGDTGADSLTDVPSAAIRGRYLAYGRVRKQGLGTSRAIVVVRDLVTHRVTFLRRAVSKTLELESFHQVVVRATGTVAWIASNIDGDGVRTSEVFMHDIGGTRRLDRGTGIAKHSLRLTPHGLQWRNRGVVRFVELR
jgi:hypothetical protein